MAKEFSPDDVSADFYSAYSEFAYRTTKAILTPVMGAVADVLKEAISDAIREGFVDAVGIPVDVIGNLFVGRKKSNG